MILRKWILVSVLCSTLVGCGGPWSSGDRVLVSKEAYDLGVTQPQRYQVVVFKYPRGPVENNTPKNYIKRLLGLPGELIAIFFGRLYRIAPPPEGEAPWFDDLKDGVPANELWERPHTNDDPAHKWFEEGKFEMLRKPPQVMMALRRIVYDNDFQAKDLVGKLDRWNPDAASAWKADKERGFTHEGKIDKVDWLRYQHLLRPTDGPVHGGIKVEPRLINDSMDYNSFQVLNGQHVDDRTPPSPHWVGDLMLECNLEVLEPKGEFWYELNKGIYRYQARFDLATGQCKLFRIDQNDKAEELASQSTRVKGPGNYMLRFANIDARLTVWVDRELPFGDGKAYDPPEVRGPNDKGVPQDVIEARRGPRPNDLKPASIGCKGAHVKIAHVRLWRDTYYTTEASRADYDRNDLTRDDWAKPERWEPIRKQRFATMYVQKGHYLCLGDNSQASSDSRDWGLVPERLMLGRALMVYFPLERIGPIR